MLPHCLILPIDHHTLEEEPYLQQRLKRQCCVHLLFGIQDQLPKPHPHWTWTHWTQATKFHQQSENKKCAVKESVGTKKNLIYLGNSSNSLHQHTVSKRNQFLENGRL
jgi:hypothetical protein